jgi:uncharacterized phage-associated protein
VNEEFRKVVYYFRAHKLVLHPDKTVFMLFSCRNQGEVNTSVYIDNNNYGANYIPELKTPILCVNNMQSPKVCKIPRCYIGSELEFPPSF